MLAQQRLLELHTAEVNHRRKIDAAYDNVLNDLESYLGPDHTKKRIKLDPQIPAFKCENMSLIVPQHNDAASPVRGIVHGVVTQLLSAVLRELTTRGRLCTAPARDS